MVLRPLVASHNWHARLRLWKNQWLMWCVAVSLLNRFLKPMVLRGVGRRQPHRGLFPGETSKWQLKIVGQRTNGWWADGLSHWQTEARNWQKWSINCICQLKNKSVCQSTIGSLADGIAKCISTKTMFFKHRVMFAVSLLNRFLKPMVLRPSVASSGVSQLVFVQSHKFRLQKNQWLM